MLTKTAPATQHKVTLEHGNTAPTTQGAITQCLQALIAAMHISMSCKSAQTAGNIHGALQSGVHALKYDAARRVSECTGLALAS